MNRLKGRVALVTGAASGIGAAVVDRLVAEGAQVVATDIATETRDASDGILPLHHDTTREADWQSVVATAADTFGPLDILVNNAGISSKVPGPLRDMDLDDWRRVIAVNLDGVFLGMKYGMRALEGRGGSIVNIASILSFAAIPDAAAYCASKGGVAQLTRAGALEGARMAPPIRVNSVHPGYVETPLVTRRFEHAPELRQGIEARTPLGRLAQPSEIAATVAFLASEDASYATGGAFTMDGGYLAR